MDDDLDDFDRLLIEALSLGTGVSLDEAERAYRKASVVVPPVEESEAGK